MPTYVVRTYPGRLDAEQKQAFVDSITRTHAEEAGGVPQWLVSVIFEEVAKDSWFINKKPAPAEQIWVRGDIRGGRTDAQRQSICKRITAECAPHAKVDSSYIWVYICDIEAASEFGAVLPEPGQEKAWVENLGKDVRERYGLY